MIARRICNFFVVYLELIRTPFRTKIFDKFSKLTTKDS